MPRLVLTTILSAILIALTGVPATAAAPQAPPVNAALKAEKLKTLFRREPRAKDMVPKVEEKLAKPPADAAEARFLKRTEDAFNSIIMAAGSLSEERLHDAVDLLSAMSGPVKAVGQADLSPLQDRYAKLCARLDDQIFIRDLESVLSLHDRFVRHTSLALWDKAETAAQLTRMEEATERAPEIPYGRTELLRSLQGKRLAAPDKGCYTGMGFSDASQLSMDRQAVGILEESTGGTMRLDYAEMVIQRPDGSLADIDAANHPATGLPFSPPPSLWMKTRLLEGHIPCLSLRLVDRAVQESYGAVGSVPAEKVMGVTDVLSGGLDDYLKRNLKLVAETKAATLIGIFSAFDRDAATAFGADGKTPYYMIVDAKLTALPADKRRTEVDKRLSKGSLTRDAGAELRNHYGDPAVADGPERVAAAWKHVRELIDAQGSGGISLFSTAGAFHGNKKALPTTPDAGAQDWNNLSSYWPGEGVLSWLAVEAVGADPTVKTEQCGLPTAVDQFVAQVRSSNWHSTPLLLSDMAPDRGRFPDREAGWLATCFVDLLPNSYPEIKGFILDYPGKITLWNPDAHGAIRKYLSSAPYFKQALRLKPAG